MKNIRRMYLFFLLLAAACMQKHQDPQPQSTMDPVKQKDTLTYLALGDSYTIGQSVSDTDRYPVRLANALDKNGIYVSKTTIIATTGWTTQNLLDAMATSLVPGDQYGLVSLLIGVNNQYQGRSLSEYETQFKELLGKSVVLAGGKKNKVFVISIPDYGYTPFGQNDQAAITADIALFNASNKRISDSLGIHYFNITPISQQGLAQPSLIASDGLHPSGIMYQEWVDLMLKDVLAMIKNN